MSNSSGNCSNPWEAVSSQKVPLASTFSVGIDVAFMPTEQAVADVVHMQPSNPLIRVSYNMQQSIAYQCDANSLFRAEPTAYLNYAQCEEGTVTQQLPTQVDFQWFSDTKERMPWSWQMKPECASRLVSWQNRPTC